MVLSIFKQAILRSLIVLNVFLPQISLADESELVNAKRTGLIEGAIQSSPHLRGSSINVSILDSVVILSGATDSSVAKSLAEQLALNVKGVDKVQNQLVVINNKSNTGEVERPRHLNLVDSRLSNVTISNKVKSQLLANRQTSGMNIDIETNNRVVTITGQVASDSERELAYWIVRNTQGVKQVIDRLDIENSDSRQVSIRTTE